MSEVPLLGKGFGVQTQEDSPLVGVSKWIEPEVGDISGNPLLLNLTKIPLLL